MKYNIKHDIPDESTFEKNYVYYYTLHNNCYYKSTCTFCKCVFFFLMYVYCIHDDYSKSCSEINN